MPGSIDPRSMAELRGIVLALKAVPREVRNEINKTTRGELNTIWREEMAERVGGMPHVDQLVLGKGARVKPGNPAQVIAASSRRPLSGGLIPDQRAKGFEFGTDDREKLRTYRRKNRRNGGMHTVTRRTRRQLPKRTPEGRAIYPAYARMGPRMISLQVQTIVRIINERLGN